LDDEIAKKSIFKQRVAHGMIGVSLLEILFKDLP
jgi:acyl dehydratase